MTKKLNNTRRAKMIAHAIDKMNSFDIYLVSDKFIGNYGHITPDMNSKDLRYVAGILWNIASGEIMTKAAENYRMSKVHLIHGNIILLDKGSRKIGERFFLNPRGNVFMVEDNGNTHYFNWRVSKFILDNSSEILESLTSIEEVEAAYGWNDLHRLACPHLTKGIEIITWWWDSKENEYYSESKIVYDRGEFDDYVQMQLNDHTAEYLTVVSSGSYICTVDFMTGNKVDDYPYVSRCKSNK